MELEQQKILKEYADKGYSVSVFELIGDQIIEVKSKNFGPYQFENDDIGHFAVLKEIEHDGIGECTSISLRTVSISDVKVLVPIDWMEILKHSGYVIPYAPMGMIMDGPFEIKQYIEDLENAYDEAGD